MNNEEFHMNRYNGILAVMKKERELFASLEKKYKKLISDFVIDLKKEKTYQISKELIKKWELYDDRIKD